MKKSIFTATICLLCSSLPSYAESINPYEHHNLQDTQKVMVSFFETKEHKIYESERMEIEASDVSKISSELNKTIEYEPSDTCDCIGEGKIFFLLKDNSEVEFRIKHGASILEYNFGKFENHQFLEMTDVFQQIIKKYYPEGILAYCDKETNAKQNLKYRIEDCLVISVNENGEKNYSFNIEPYDYFLNLIAVHTKSYPPHFENEQQRKIIENNLKSLIGIVEIVLENHPTDIELLLRQGFAHSMGHNLDFEGSADKASSTFEKLLTISPDHPRGNYLYGILLASTANRQKDSIKYLEKALEGGMDDALYTLGLIYASQGEEEKGLEYLEKYQKLNPENKHSKEMIQAIKNEKIQFHYSY